MNTEVFQEQLLRQHANETGVLRELVFFHAFRQDGDALMALRAVCPVEHADRVFLDVMLAQDAALADGLIELALADPDPWCVYTLVKGMLRQGQLEKAAATARKRCERMPSDTLSLNLVARWAHCRNEAELAEEAVASSLALNPDQGDMRALLTAPPAGEPYLGHWPKPFRVAFYVPVYNVETYLEGALEGMLRQSVPLVECIVVNDGTEDDSMSIARRFPARIVEHERNRGLSAARNTAFNATTAELVGAVDSDACPEVSFSRMLLLEYENGSSLLAGTGGNLIEMYDKTPPDHWRARHLPQRSNNTARLVNPRFLYGSNTIMRRKHVLDAGGFDEKYRTNYEDVDLCSRLRAKGLLLVHSPLARAFHLRRDTIESVLRTRWNWMRWDYEADGRLEDAAGYIRYFQDMLWGTIGQLQRDIAEEALDLVYLDFLMFFFDVFCSINYGVEKKLFTPAQARALQLHLMAQIKLLDTRFGGALLEKMAHHLIGLIQKENSAEGVDLSKDEQFSGFLQELRGFLNDLPESFYRHITA